MLYVRDERTAFYFLFDKKEVEFIKKITGQSRVNKAIDNAKGLKNIMGQKSAMKFKNITPAEVNFLEGQIKKLGDNYRHPNYKDIPTEFI